MNGLNRSRMKEVASTGILSALKQKGTSASNMETSILSLATETAAGGDAMKLCVTQSSGVNSMVTYVLTAA